MFSGMTSIVFVASFIAIVLLFVLRFVEVKMNVGLFKRLDPYTQKLVTMVSVCILKYVTITKRFLLVHFYHVSSETTKSIFKQTMDKQEALLEKLRGNKPKLAEEKIEENVSPFLREISRIDRKED